MNGLQNVRNNIKELYHVHGVKMKSMYQIILMLSALFVVNSAVGTISILKNPVISIVIALIAGMLPLNLGILIIGCVTIAHVFKISMFVALLCFAILFLAGIMSIRMAPDHKYVGIVAFIVSSLGGAFATPLILAVSSTVSGVVPMISGIVCYRVLNLLKQSKELLMEMSAIDGTLEFLKIVAADKQLFVIIVVSMVTYITVVLIKVTDADHSWKIALFTGAGINLGLVFLLNILFGSKVSIISVLIVTVIGLVVGLLIEFFIHNVDYQATQVLNFEDDEYFYYVKAVPKKAKDPSISVTDSKLGKRPNRANRPIAKEDGNSAPEGSREPLRSKKSNPKDSAARRGTKSPDKKKSETRDRKKRT